MDRDIKTAAASTEAPAPASANAGTPPAQGLATGDTPAAALRFNLLRNVRYHGARERFFAFVSRLIQLVSAVSATAAGATLISTMFDESTRNVVSAALAFAVGGMTAINLIFDLGGAARLHGGLKQRFAAILAEFEHSPGLQPDVLTATRDMNRLYGEEPLAMNVIDAMAWNDTARGFKGITDPQALIPISRWHLLFGHFWPYANFDSRTLAERP